MWLSMYLTHQLFGLTYLSVKFEHLLNLTRVWLSTYLTELSQHLFYLTIGWLNICLTQHVLTHHFFDLTSVYSSFDRYRQPLRNGIRGVVDVRLFQPNGTMRACFICLSMFVSKKRCLFAFWLHGDLTCWWGEGLEIMPGSILCYGKGW